MTEKLRIPDSFIVVQGIPGNVLLHGSTMADLFEDLKRFRPSACEVNLNEDSEEVKDFHHAMQEIHGSDEYVETDAADPVSAHRWVTNQNNFILHNIPTETTTPEEFFELLQKLGTTGATSVQINVSNPGLYHRLTRLTLPLSVTIPVTIAPYSK